ncbi:multiple PDZ domain protein-like [Cyrtonyx montezumae]|uniref:multiple PDZ domain protein-like n=1 Tax=Cyrtonyx montezumae TaxID=9017 RepID=UPI0032DA109C
MHFVTGKLSVWESGSWKVENLGCALYNQRKYCEIGGQEYSGYTDYHLSTMSSYNVDLNERIREQDTVMDRGLETETEEEFESEDILDIQHDKEVLMESSCLLTMDKSLTSSDTSESVFEETTAIAEINSTLGMTVSSDEGATGMKVCSVIHGGTISPDGCFSVGDCIQPVNEESATNLTSAQAWAMLRTCSPTGPEMNVMEISELQKHEEGEGEESELQNAAFIQNTALSSWNQPRKVELWREPGESLGISIAGGRGMGSCLSGGEVMRAIFIKHILEDSPAGRNGMLKTGDRIVEVDGINLRDASHEQAMEVIQNAGNPVVFVVQSIISRPKAYGQFDSEPDKTLFCNFPLPPSSMFSGISCDVSWSSSSQASEDEFSYSWKKITQRYGNLPGELHMDELGKGKTGLGLSLAGNKDQSRMNVCIVGTDPNGEAGKDGRLQIADELLELFEEKQPLVSETLQNQQIGSAADSGVSSDFSSYKNIQYVELPKDEEGLEIVISEEDTVNEVVIRSLTDNGAAAKDGRIKVGNQILAVDDSMILCYSPTFLYIIQFVSLLKTSRNTVRLTINSAVADSLTAAPVPSSSTPAERRNGQPSATVHSFNSPEPEAIKNDSSPFLLNLLAAASETQGLRTVEIKKTSGDSLGLSISGGVGSPLGDIPIFIAMMHPIGVAAQTQKLRVGDRIVSICGKSTEGMTHSQAVSILKNASDTIELQVVAGGDVSVITGQQQDLPVSSLSVAGQTSTSIFQDVLGPPLYKTITLDRRQDGQGFIVVGVYGSPRGGLPICVKTVFAKIRICSVDPFIKRGYQIIAVNAQSLEGVAYEEAVTVLKITKGTVTLSHELIAQMIWVRVSTAPVIMEPGRTSP